MAGAVMAVAVTKLRKRMAEKMRAAIKENKMGVETLRPKAWIDAIKRKNPKQASLKLLPLLQKENDPLAADLGSDVTGTK